MHYVYILSCSDNSLYTGYTTDLERRVNEHNEGKGAKYTRGRTPVELVYHEKKKSKSLAMKREYEIKQLSRAEKLKLISKKGS
ncbi:MAG: GIY-YIG nuclease family protein [Bacillota bacterium]